MKACAIFLSIIICSGSLRFFNISIIDEAFFILLILLLIFYRRALKYKNNIKLGYPNKYYKRSVISFMLLFSYLILSLFYGLSSDLYFGKIRWLVILVMILMAESGFRVYFQNRFLKVDRFVFLKLVYNYILNFALFYLLYGSIALFLFDISPGLLQAAQTDSWYAIWGTSAYVSVIFLPLLLINKALRLTNRISKLRYIIAYIATLLGVLVFDSRIMAATLLGFCIAEFADRSKVSKAIISILLIIPIYIFRDQLNFGSWSSSGGFLFSLYTDNPVKNTVGDFDRVAHYFAAYRLLSESVFDSIIGVGFLNAGKEIIPAYISVYQDYGVTVSKIETNISGKSVGTFGLSAFIIENGLVGLTLLILHIYNLCMVSLKTELILPGFYIVITYFLLLLILFSIYINDNMIFYLFLIPSTFIYPLLSNYVNNNDMKI